MVLSAAKFSSLVDIYERELDSLIENLGKKVIIHFKSTVSNVGDKFNDPVRNLDNRRPIFGGDISNPAPTEILNTKEIIALTEVNPSTFETYGINIQNPKSIIALKTYAIYINDLKRCDFIVANANAEQNIQQKWGLVRDVIPVGLQRNRYCLSFWETI